MLPGDPGGEALDADDTVREIVTAMPKLDDTLSDLLQIPHYRMGLDDNY